VEIAQGSDPLDPNDDGSPTVVDPNGLYAQGGCGCSTSTSGGASLWGVLVLLGWRRRRRA